MGLRLGDLSRTQGTASGASPRLRLRVPAAICSSVVQSLSPSRAAAGGTRSRQEGQGADSAMQTASQGRGCFTPRHHAYLQSTTRTVAYQLVHVNHPWIRVGCGQAGFGSVEAPQVRHWTDAQRSRPPPAHLAGVSFVQWILSSHTDLCLSRTTPDPRSKPSWSLSLLVTDSRAKCRSIHHPPRPTFGLEQLSGTKFGASRF